MRIKKLQPNSKSVADIPELKNEAHGWDPSKIGLWSKHRVPWKCTEGHIWEQVVKERVRQKIGCPVCSNLMVFLGFNDLLTVRPEIASEADGWDPSTIVFSSSKIKRWKCKQGHTWSATVEQRYRKGTRCRICSQKNKGWTRLPKLINSHPNLIDYVKLEVLEKYTFKSTQRITLPCDKGHSYQMTLRSLAKRGPFCTVCSGRILLKGVNDFASQYPEVASEAYGWDPTATFKSSKVNRKWKCPIGHIYESSIQTRVRGYIQKKGNGCAFCGNRKVLPGFNDIKTLSSELASEAFGWDPSTISPWTLKKFKWKCIHGHIYPMSPAARFQGHGCFTCNSGGFNPTKDGYLYLIQQFEWGLLQIGITNIPKQRIKQHEKTGWKLLDLFGPADGLLIREWENSIINYLRKKGINSPPVDIAGTFVGITESWIETDYQIYTLRKLMNEVKSEETY
jgi:hypothetical protein